MPDRPPHLHDGKAPLQELVGLIGEQVAHALWAGPFGIVVVNATYDLADLARLALLIIRRAQGVIEDDNARGAAFGFHQRFHLRIIDPADLVLVEEIRHFRVVTNKTEAVAIEHERLRIEPRIADRHAMGVDRAAAAHVRRARRRRLSEDFLPVIEKVVDRRLDGFVDRFPFDNRDHRQLPGVAAARLCHPRRQRAPRYTSAWRARQSTQDIVAAPPCPRGGAQISEPRGDGEYCCLKRRMRNVLLCERAAREISRGMRLPGGAPMTDYTYDFVNVRVRDGIAWAALNRPAKRNAMSPPLHYEMDHALARPKVADNLNVLILTAEPANSSAGQHLKKFFRELENHPAERKKAAAAANRWRWERPYGYDKPTIAMVHGYCVGGAFMQLLACDFAIAAENAIFSLSEVNSGILPGALVSKAVADTVLPRHALYYACLGEPFDGKEAARIGMINYAGPAEKLEAATVQLAQKLIKKSPTLLPPPKQPIPHAPPTPCPHPYP